MFCFYLEKRKRLAQFHVIHAKDCDLLPDTEGREKLGYFESFEKLTIYAEMKYGNIKLCSHCCNVEK